MPPTRTSHSFTSVSGKASPGRHVSVDSDLSSELTNLERDTLSPTPDIQGPAPVRSTRSSFGDLDRRNYADPYSIPRPRLSRIYSGTELLDVADVPVATRPRPQYIKIHGRTFKPTAVFDTFWYWCSERHAIYERRRVGQPFPWTDDKYLQTSRFCNTFRVLDKVSQYLIREVIEKGSQDPTELVFRIVLFNIFTKPATWEVLVEELGPLEWSRYRRKDYIKVLTELNECQAIFTGSFLKNGPRLGYEDVFVNHLVLLEIMMDKDLAGIIQNAQYMAEIHSFFHSLPGMANFNAYQLLLNLSYSNIMQFSGMDFVVPCKGSIAGLVRIFGQEMQKLEKDPSLGEAIMRWFATHQTEQFRRLGLKPPKLGPKGQLMELADIEHALCEVDKYCRLSKKSFNLSDSDLEELREKFSTSYPSTAILPKAWTNPQRRVARRFPGGGFPAMLKQYVVQSLRGHRRAEDGSIEFHVHWSGYNRERDHTWEREWSLLEDSPAVVEEYRKKLGCVVDCVEDMRTTAKSREFLVFWSAFDAKDATWEPEARLRRDAPVVLAEFLRKRGMSTDAC
ncbi:hypothetical protein D9758_013116 [Tetrapyrgos nigripes]|uniref:Chromo domain-containing protein n=1 Tax=Tetrapyrgos nigripes TaxID=182062 RepID=A0A8H5C9U6_9AGAR|nr:hypothetical protein D9758_013116 [Tetrapyrgos nigripes]